MFFNVGVEIGQILFVGALVAGFFLLRPLLLRIVRGEDGSPPHWTTLTTPASYAVGIIAAYWMIDRINGFWA